MYFSDSWQTFSGSLCVCVLWVRGVKCIKALCGFTGREKRTLPSMLGAPGILPALHVPCCFPKRPTQASTVALISAPPVLSRTVLLLCRQTNRLSSSGVPVHQTAAGQPSSAGCCGLSPLVWTSSVWLCYIWRWPSSGATSPSQARILKDWWAPRACSGLTGAGGGANGTSRHILTGPVSPWLNKSTTLIWFNPLIHPPPLRLLQNAMPCLVSVPFIISTLTSIHSFLCVLCRDFNRREL